MATAASTEELREAVLLCFGAGTLVFLIAHFVGQIVSFPVNFKDLDWMTSSTLSSCCWPVPAMLQELEQERAARQESVMNAALFGC